MNQLEYLPVVFSELLIYKVPMHFLCKYIILNHRFSISILPQQIILPTRKLLCKLVKTASHGSVKGSYISTASYMRIYAACLGIAMNNPWLFMKTP